MSCAVICAHKQNRTQWVSANHPGVHQPHLAEISPMQYGLLGKTARARYDRKRAAEWAAWSAASQAYDAAVIAEHYAGLLVVAKATPDALEVLRCEVSRCRKAEEQRLADEKQVVREEAERVTAETLKPGDRVRHMGREYIVAKVNRKTAGIRRDDGGRVYTAPIQLLSRVLDEVRS